MFIVIDGIDGSGKATQLELISDYLRQLGKKVKILDYPRYGNKAAFAVEEYLKGNYGAIVSAKKASLFYAIDRFDEYEKYKDSFNEYDYIISNRYVSASIIHQAGKIRDKKEREEFIKWLEDLEYNILGIPKPDITFFLDLEPNITKILIDKRGKNKDIHELDDKHMLSAYNNAKEVSELKKDWIKIKCLKDGNILSKEIIRDLILKKIL